ncbi:hypothetical protein TEA_011843 [Camellia sinensis var. sinensis]|uniref:RING-type domain-containing protein n=1 Tax=Camellia sinensis var. sinensis TaxID=542762 RepID=A0A4S4E9N2_CAMSN|nr:hypothetical protein TEA_011843 [Camellia sinensis var. sinensis]
MGLVTLTGYLIPKGWKVMPLFRNIHHNPEFFPDPKHFDPSRFEVAAQSNTFILFGNGVHACPGNELAELEMLIVVHHLVIKFSPNHRKASGTEVLKTASFMDSLEMTRESLQRGFHITFVNTEFNHKRLLKSRGPDSLNGLSSFRFETIPDGLPESDADATHDIPLHTSDYIDSDDEDLFNSILDRISTQARQPKHLSHTSKSFINSLPILKITGSLLSKSCSICKDEFEKNDQVNPLPCDHVFHHNCILPWLNRSNSCPLCRYKLPMERRPKPLMLYVVRLGHLYVEGWGEDHESGFRDAVLRNGLFAVLTQQQSSSSFTATRMGRASGNC